MRPPRPRGGRLSLCSHIHQPLSLATPQETTSIPKLKTWRGGWLHQSPPRAGAASRHGRHGGRHERVGLLVAPLNPPFTSYADMATL